MTTGTGNQRYRQTVGLAIKFFRQLLWTRRTRFGRSPAEQDKRLRALYTHQAREFREFALACGGLIIKLGQFLSVRIDILPKEYIDELGLLQDAVPPVDSATMMGEVERELGRPLDDLFDWFDPEPLAAASLGQVHRARLKTGQTVAVKIQRPGIEELVDTDLRSLRSIIRLLDRFTSVTKFFDPEEFCRDFEATFRQELDYLKEGANAERFQRNFLTNMHVDMPQIYWEYTTTRVLTMEYMDGMKLNDLAAIDQAGIDRTELAQNLLGLFLQMLLVDGFFHADPHPGNILVRRDGIIQLIDFGMVGVVPPDMSQGFVDLLVALIGHDASGMIAAMRHLGFISPSADTRLLKQTLVPLVDTMVSQMGTLMQGPVLWDQMMRGSVHVTINADVLDAIRELILDQPITLPGNVTFIGKALITIFTNCGKLDPGLDYMAVVEPYVKNMTSSTQDILARLAAESWDLLRALPRTAKRIVSLAEKLDDGELEVRLSPAQWKRLEALSRRQRRWTVTSALVASGLTAGLVILLRRRT